ncbi:hypothetical protein LF817_11150 [Halobacillus sp. A1]|uniref:Phage protein n=1 Tax=Halobacillus campisalis TaxID=435909 RepID=A0ABW2K530_9BACI|nr:MULTISPECIES: hypothetical protein [Halobacillus]MCP3031901.1 hypothetical protein [Halobacillus sp. A1]
MGYKLIAKDAKEIVIEFAKNNKEIVFETYQEANEFAVKVKKENRWTTGYEFSIIEDE